MKVRDILEKKEFKYREVITIGPNDTISAAIRKMTEYDRGSLPVCEESGELVGIVTERDVARKCAVDEKCAILKIQDVMSPDVVTTNPDDDIDAAIDMMKKRRIRHVPVWENGKVVGMITMRDLVLLQLV